MAYYPQLSTGHVSQYPLKKTRTFRVIRNNLADGSAIQQLDLAPPITSWELHYSCLSDAERSELESFYIASEGRLHTFSLLDPSANLIRWSEDFSKSVWTIDAGLASSTGLASPNGGMNATRFTNPTPLPQRIRQVIDAPGDFHYCFSFHARSSGNDSISAIRQAVGVVKSDIVQLTASWQRYWYNGNLQQSSTTLSFGIELNGGGAAEFYGMQVMAQPGAGSYHKTMASSGIYRNMRFADDRLVFTQNAPNDNSIQIQLITVG